MGQARINSGVHHWNGNRLFRGGKPWAEIFPRRQKQRQPWASRKGVICGWEGRVWVRGAWQAVSGAGTRREAQRNIEAILALEE